jgi:hypothetical protein
MANLTGNMLRYLADVHLKISALRRDAMPGVFQNMTGKQIIINKNGDSVLSVIMIQKDKNSIKSDPN